jgi:Glycoside Hydrolase Family 113
VANPTFLSQFIALVQEPQGLILFHRKGLPPLLTRPIPANLLTEHSLCNAGSPRHIRSLAVRHLQRPQFQTGLVFPRLGSTSYSQKDTAWLSGIREIQVQTGAHWIEIPIAFSQASLTSTSVSAGPDAPAISSFAYGIRAAHALGFHVFVTPILSTRRAPYWSGAINFSTFQQEQAWFESYWQALKPYVRAAAQEGVEQLAVGTEFEWLEQFAPEVLWNRLIAHIRNVFPGTLTYDMNWSAVLTSPSKWLRNPDLNMIGISAYFPLIDISMRVDSKRLSDLWMATERNALDTLATALDKPILLSEIGYRDSADAVYRTWEGNSAALADPEEQALACDAAMINVFDDPHIVGTFFWGWDDVSAFRLRGMPATAVIHTWYTSLETE